MQVLTIFTRHSRNCRQLSKKSTSTGKPQAVAGDLQPRPPRDQAPDKKTKMPGAVPEALRRQRRFSGSTSGWASDRRGRSLMVPMLSPDRAR